MEQILEKTDDDPIVKFVNQILLEAIKNRASDIHFELYEQEYRIRYRQDGILRTVLTPPPYLSTRITARLKVMAHLDIAEKRIPQDGSFKIMLPSQSIHFRMSTCPVNEGEKVVIRILDSDPKELNIDLLGFNPAQKLQFIQAIQKPQGMILVTGPTGSGKTLTLYTALNELNNQEVNIVTVEDPVEIKIHGINQVNINPKAGLSFAKTLRAFLRQDPDIIMVGEIRDLESAEIAVKAAQTGHLVLSTLHTNSAAQTLNRLKYMGIPPFNIASSINLILAQRLVRKLCAFCKKLREDLTSKNLLRRGFRQSTLGDAQLYQAVGCSHCSNGYSGRIGLFELLAMTPSLEQLIISKANSQAIFELAQSEGMLSLFESGLEKVRSGITSIEELHRVCIA